MSEHSTLQNPQDDAEKIRLKRLAKLQGASTSGSGSTSPAPSTSSTPAQQAQPKPTPKPRVPVVSPAVTTPTPSPAPKKKVISAAKLDVNTWEHETVGFVFKITLSKAVAEQTGYETVWLKPLAEELEAEGMKDVRLTCDLADRILIARLEIDPQAMSDDYEFLAVIASLPAQQTIFEYLVGCWKRLNQVKSALNKKGYAPVDYEVASAKLDKIRHLVVSYAGLIIQIPDMFPQPQGKPLGPPELVAPLLGLSALAMPLLSSSDAQSTTLGPSDIGQFVQDLVHRFEPENELEGVLGPVITGLLYHPSLLRPEGLGGGDSSWRGVIGGLELLVSIKSVAVMITKLPEWNPPDATAANFEKVSLLGPLCRLGVFAREWPGIGQMYFSEPEKRSRGDVESSYASLRGTLKSLQSSLFQIFNTLVRASPEAREAVLDYFTRVISLNVKRAGMQVNPDTVSSDSFMLNLQSVLYRFAEPFMDATFSKMDKIDPLYYANSPRIDLKDETRIKATSEEATQWETQNRNPNAPPANFISNIFYLTIAMSHYGYVKIIQNFTGLARHIEDIQRHLETVEGDGSWMGGPQQARTQAVITQIKKEKEKIQGRQMAYEAGLLDPELVMRSISFTNFLSTWLIRQADPRKKHPNPPAEIPLPTEVPMSFRVLPEYIVEDIVEYMVFAVQYAPDKFELSGKIELMTFILTFLNSTWYIKNPFLKSKINDALFMGVWGFGRERTGILGDLLNSNPMALKHLMPALMHFYIEVEQTGASSQFYDKFNARRNIAFVLKIVWNNPIHREALNIEAKNVDKFVRFVNLMINDVTYLMDESLTEMQQISALQKEMDDQATWAAQTEEYRREKSSQLRSLERHASSYTTLGRSTVELLKVFTSETKAPFMMPEIVDRLAAMLDYNLNVMTGPRYQELRVRDPKKLRFDPRALLSDILQIFLNLSDQPEFIQGVARDGRSYSRELFEHAAEIAIRRTLKTEGEVEVLRAFVQKVEVVKAEILMEDEDLDDVPEEFLDPLMATLMKDPVTLPSSKVVIDRATIKSHLLSDTKDPFNRAPLSIEEIIPNLEMKARIEAFLEEKRKKKMEVD